MEREALEIRAGRNIIIIISANTAEHVRPIRPNMCGQYGRTGSAILAEPFGSAEHGSAKKWFGLVRFGRNRVRSITNNQ